MSALQIKCDRAARLFAVGALLSAALLASACATTSEPAPSPSPGSDLDGAAIAPGPVRPVGPGAAPRHLQTEGAELVQVALLLPFSSRSAGARAEAASMLEAAQLAMFDHGHERMVLVPKDTAGTSDGARAAARSALDDGADVILGPLFGGSVGAVVEEARPVGAPVVSFSNDLSAAGLGAYLLSITPEEEIDRLVDYASRQGVRSFYAFAPASPYGYRVRDAVEASARDWGGLLADFELYPASADATDATEPARRLAGAIVAAAEASTPSDGFSGALGGEPTGPELAVIVPEGGVRLLSVAPLLPFYDVDPREVRFLGTSLWADESVAREPTLSGGWFVGPDPIAHERFVDSYRAAFDDDPSRLAGFAYDAVVLASVMTERNGAAGLTREAFENPEGFYGADGLFRFGPDGAAEWGLAVFEVRGGVFEVLEPAPRAFAPSGF